MGISLCCEFLSKKMMLPFDRFHENNKGNFYNFFEKGPLIKVALRIMKVVLALVIYPILFIPKIIACGIRAIFRFRTSDETHLQLRKKDVRKATALLGNNILATNEVRVREQFPEIAEEDSRSGFYIRVHSPLPERISEEGSEIKVEKTAPIIKKIQEEISFVREKLENAITLMTFYQETEQGIKVLIENSDRYSRSSLLEEVKKKKRVFLEHEFFSKFCRDHLFVLYGQCNCVGKNLQSMNLLFSFCLQMKFSCKVHTEGCNSLHWDYKSRSKKSKKQKGEGDLFKSEDILRELMMFKEKYELFYSDPLGVGRLEKRKAYKIQYKFSISFGIHEPDFPSPNKEKKIKGKKFKAKS